MKDRTIIIVCTLAVLFTQIVGFGLLILVVLHKGHNARFGMQSAVVRQFRAGETMPGEGFIQKPTQKDEMRRLDERTLGLPQRDIFVPNEKDIRP